MSEGVHVRILGGQRQCRVKVRILVGPGSVENNVDPWWSKLVKGLMCSSLGALDSEGVNVWISDGGMWMEQCKNPLCIWQ